MNNVGEDLNALLHGNCTSMGFCGQVSLLGWPNNCPSCPVCPTHLPCHCQRQRPCPTRFPSTNPTTLSTAATSPVLQFEGLVNESTYERLYLKHEVIVSWHFIVYILIFSALLNVIHFPVGASGSFPR
jgi:hypothetical protein